MNNNDVLRRIRYALNLRDSAMAGIFTLAGHDIPESAIPDIIKKEDEEGYVECSDRELEMFLDSLIVDRRGKRENTTADPNLIKKADITNNMILKKLRIALDFKEEDMLGIFRLGEFEITKSELSALFRNKNHKNYKECGDQLLKKFLNGLTVHFRGKK
ncbi:MAG: DUF1456 family protein [Spirochaetia bacterium]|jgi:uncharacterized protein YehS (DUF1456 family)|nr:DUF1456 family protein [Spirochaetia bacterium]